MATLPKDFVGGRPPVIRSVIVKITDDSSHAIVRPSWEAYALFSFLLLAFGGMFGLIFVFLLEVEGVTSWSSRSAEDVDIRVRVLAWVFVVIPLLLILHLLFHKFPQKVQFDRANAVMTVRRCLRLPKHYRLQSLVGLQVCAKFFHGHVVAGGGGGPGYDARELNAVFADGHTPRRIRIMAHSDYSNFIKDAEVLAKFLGAPLIRSDQ